MEFSEFAMYEAALIRANATDKEWAEAVQMRPSLEGALEARQRAAEAPTSR
ncbi:hypothetical protein [Streptomyces griseorubiginosus]|uniref:hypothetical protein n=1 Tax=Streptomyces griseorubiginosus TaxID=67304 RepID=UPI0036E134D5